MAMILLLAALVSHDPLPPVPGAVNPAVTQGNLASTVCQRRQRGHTTTWVHDQRPPTSYTNALKRQLMVSMHLPGALADYELDHLWSIEAGGNPRDPQNLWMQRWHGPWNARDKDRIEDDVHRRLCAGTITLEQAGRELTVDWMASYRARFGLPASVGH